MGHQLVAACFVGCALCGTAAAGSVGGMTLQRARGAPGWPAGTWRLHQRVSRQCLSFGISEVTCSYADGEQVVQDRIAVVCSVWVSFMEISFAARRL